jgi:hypothetical protein
MLAHSVIINSSDPVPLFVAHAVMPMLNELI